jgi:hypothetical protein
MVSFNLHLLFLICSAFTAVFPTLAFAHESFHSKLVASRINQGQITFRFDPILSEENYQTALALNDYSNAIAIAQTSPTSSGLVPFLNQRSEKISSDLKSRGWAKLSILRGATGKNNREQDFTGLITWNRKKQFIIVSFHGSRNGSILLNDGSGDWGANLDSVPSEISEIGLLHRPPFQVKVHRGFGRNFQSIQNTLNQKIDQILTHFTQKELKQTWIWVTGHSKGAAMASLAAVFVKSHLNQKRKPFKQVNLAALLFSAPRVFFEDQFAPNSTQWVHSIVGKENILRINVHRDPVPVFFQESRGWRDLGILVKDDIRDVNARAHHHYGQNVSGFFNLHGWAGYHYGSGLRSTSVVHTGYEFDPNIVIAHFELPKGLREGALHSEQRSLSKFGL